MNAETRRSAILTLLSQAEAPISAATLAGSFSVSRQIIVGDIALLRAAGEQISATPRGYVLQHDREGLIKTVATVHTAAQTEQELCIMVDNGCTVLDVVVEHPIYGQITGQLQLTSRYDISQFVERLQTEGGEPLSALTNGIHLHTLQCPDEAAYHRTRAGLKAAGMLLETE